MRSAVPEHRRGRYRFLFAPVLVLAPGSRQASSDLRMTIGSESGRSSRSQCSACPGRSKPPRPMSPQAATSLIKLYASLVFVSFEYRVCRNMHPATRKCIGCGDPERLPFSNSLRRVMAENTEKHSTSGKIKFPAYIRYHTRGRHHPYDLLMRHVFLLSCAVSLGYAQHGRLLRASDAHKNRGMELLRLGGNAEDLRECCWTGGRLSRQVPDAVSRDRWRTDSRERISGLQD
jgi:hypothetical protein